MKNEENKQWSPDLLTEEDAKKFLKELREMPYDTSCVGQVFITTFYKSEPEIEKSKEIDPRLIKENYNGKQ